MRLSELRGYGDRMTQLMRSLTSGNIVHALLFTGPRGTGKRTTARLFAQASVCAGQEKPCGVCPACKRFLAGTHPDIHYLNPPDKKNSIGVDEIRALTEALGMRSFEGGRHIAIIEQADAMTVPAQNALLKTLENPVGDVLFILISETGGALLNTILSRCQSVRFHPLSREECAEVLIGRGMEKSRAELLSGLAQGAVGRALELDGDNSFFTLREQTLNALASLNGTASVAAAAAPLTEAKGSEKVILEILELWARDLIAVQSGCEPFESTDKARLAASRLSGIALLKGVVRARQQLSANVAWGGVAEELLFSLTA